jgi:hypothetical protein
MKKTLTRAGAIGMAAATIFTGLSFGPAAASAAPANTTAAQDVPDERFKLISETEPGLFQTVAAYHFTVHGYPTRAEAESAGQEFKIVQREGGFEMEVTTGSFAGWCLISHVPVDSYVPIVTHHACGTNAALFSTDAEGHIKNVARNQFIAKPIRYGNYTYFGLTDSADSALRFDEFGRSFDATVDSVDVAARSAQISGRAEPNAAVIINGTDEVVADDTGAWSANVTGLTLGKNTITLEQWEGGEKTADATVEVDLAVQPVVATTTFPTDRSQNAVTSGTAHPGADVVITDAAGTEIGRTTASTTDGTWSIEIPAPNLGGDYPVTIHQEIDGDVDGEIAHTIAYGAAVAITAPVEGMAHDGGAVDMQGIGEARAGQ